MPIDPSLLPVLLVLVFVWLFAFLGGYLGTLNAREVKKLPPREG